MTKEEFEAKFSASLSGLLNDIIEKLAKIKRPEDLKVEIFLKTREISKIVTEYVESSISIISDENNGTEQGSGEGGFDPTQKNRGGI